MFCSGHIPQNDMHFLIKVDMLGPRKSVEDIEAVDISAHVCI